MTEFDSGAAAHAATTAHNGCGAGPRASVPPAHPHLVGRTLAEVERDLILETLAACAGNRTRAARLLGISIRTLRNRLGDYARAGIRVPGPAQAAAPGRAPQRGLAPCG